MTRLLYVFLLTVLSVCGASATPPASPAGEERMIIVSFADRGINAAPAAAPGDFYAPGPVGAAGGYATTPWSRRLTDRLARDYALELVTDWPIQTLGVHCAVFRVGAEVTVEDMIKKLEGDARVGGVQRMNSFRVLHSAPAAGAHDLSAIELDAAHRLSTGRNVRIAVVDTGIDIHHPDLAGQIAEMHDLVTDSDTDHDDVHGTAVAGIIAALGGNHEGIVGVAPGAKLMALRACWPETAADPGAVCNSLTLARALDMVVRERPDVLNLSLAGPADPLLSALLKAALDAGVVVVAAAPAAQSPAASFPTALPGVIEVAPMQTLVASDSADTLVRAPGIDILTTFPHGDYDFISGSSFAAAHVSGVVALLLELHPGMPVADLRRLLTRQTIADEPEARTDATRVPFRAAVSDERVCVLMSHLGRSAECAPDDAPQSPPHRTPDGRAS